MTTCSRTRPKYLECAPRARTGTGYRHCQSLPVSSPGAAGVKNPQYQSPVLFTQAQVLLSYWGGAYATRGSHGSTKQVSLRIWLAPVAGPWLQEPDTSSPSSMSRSRATKVAAATCSWRLQRTRLYKGVHGARHWRRHRLLLEPIFSVCGCSSIAAVHRTDELPMGGTRASMAFKLQD